ncbi:MAG: hypothetical protein ACRENE_12040 [Polyangiaceae bacterium]
MRGSYGDVVIKEIEPVEQPANEVVHSWAPQTKPRGPGEKKAPTDRFRDLLKSYASWIIVVALAVDALALVLEPIELLRHGAPLSAALASTLASFGLAVLFAFAAAAPIGCVYSAVRYIGRLRRPWSHAWPLPLLLLGWLIVVWFAPRPAALALTRVEAKCSSACSRSCSSWRPSSRDSRRPSTGARSASCSGSSCWCCRTSCLRRSTTSRATSCGSASS